LFSLSRPPHPPPPLFPYTTLFRSVEDRYLVPTSPLAPPADSVTSVPRQDAATQWEEYAHWLSKQVADRDLDLADAGRELCERERSEEHTSELQSQSNLVCRLLLEK